MARKLMTWLVAPVVLFVVAMAGTTVSAAAKGNPHRPPPYGPHTCTVVVAVSPPTVGHGGTITVTLSGTCVSDKFSIIVKGRTLGTIATNAGGAGSGTFALPCAVNVGTHMVFAVDPIGNNGSATLQVTPAPCASAGGHDNGLGPPPRPHPHRPGTGSDLRIAGVEASAGIPVGAAAVGMAGLLILGGRKRRQRRHFTA